MKQFVRLMSTMMLVLVVLVGAVLPVAAQDGPTGVNCNGLSAEDCQMLTDATAALATMASFTVPNWSFGLDIAVGAEAMNLSGNGSARLVIPDALIALLSDVPTDEMDMDTLTAFYQMITTDLILNVVDDMGGELVVDHLKIMVPGEAPVNLSGLQIMYKDHGVYLHMASPTGADAWFGETFEITPEMIAELEAGVAELQAEVTAGIVDPELTDALDQLDDLTALMMPLVDLVDAHTTTVRGADVEMMGQTMAPFTTTVDVMGILSDPTLAAALIRIIEDPMLNEAAGDELEDLGLNEAQLQFALALVATVFKEATISSTTVVGVDDGLVHQIGMDLIADLDLAILGDPSMPGAQINMGYEMTFDAINSTTLDDLAAPATYHSMDMVDSFLMGDPGMIDATVALGDTYSGEMGYDGAEHMLALPLATGDAVMLTLTSGDYPYVDIYAPDGFVVGEYDTYYDAEMVFTAAQDGTYIVVVKSSWDMSYDLAIAAQ
ncbi:MAG: hypothetical protein K8S97_14095 [Anaerolineae bacterium]|nr:hypothetical protein [Anaerolineae bacterium]